MHTLAKQCLSFQSKLITGEKNLTTLSYMDINYQHGIFPA